MLQQAVQCNCHPRLLGCACLQFSLVRRTSGVRSEILCSCTDVSSHTILNICSGARDLCRTLLQGGHANSVGAAALTARRHPTTVCLWFEAFDNILVPCNTCHGSCNAKYTSRVRTFQDTLAASQCCARALVQSLTASALHHCGLILVAAAQDATERPSQFMEPAEEPGCFPQSQRRLLPEDVLRRRHHHCSICIHPSALPIGIT